MLSKHVKPWLLPAMCLLPAVAALGQASPARRDATLRLNDIAAIGTHNSYKLPMPAATMAKVRAVEPAMADALDYGHRPLVEQLDAGARHCVRPWR